MIISPGRITLRASQFCNTLVVIPASDPLQLVSRPNSVLVRWLWVQSTELASNLWRVLRNGKDIYP